MRVASLLFVAAAIEAWVPFRPDVPWSRRHPPVVLAEGAAHFDGTAALLSDPDRPPPWLAALDRDAPFTVHLRAAAADAEQDGPARLLALSGSIYSANVVVGQQGDRLTVRVRRPGSDWRGEPALDGGPIFADGAAHDIDLAIDGDVVELRVDGALQDRREAQGGVLSHWEQQHRLALGDEPTGDRGWRGTLSEAVVQGDDLLRGPTLHAAEGTVIHTRLTRFWRLLPDDRPSITVARIGSFLLLGLAVPPRRRTVLAAAVFPFALTLGKVFIATRDPILADAILASAATLTGIALLRLAPRAVPPLRPLLTRLHR